jgi:hypothetical protein
LPHRQTWAFLIGKFLTDPIWWFFLFWLPKFLNTNHGLELTALGPPLVVIYNAACVGSIGGGWLSARFLKAGWSVNRARKVAMLICAVTIIPIVAAANVPAKGRRLSSGNRWVWRCCGRHADCGFYRVDASDHGQLRSHVRHRRLHLSDCTPIDPPAHTTNGPSQARIQRMITHP